MQPCPFYPCLFVLREGPESDQPGALNGILGIHVDDGICAGNQKFQEILRKIEAKYAFETKKDTVLHLYWNRPMPTWRFQQKQ